MGWFSCLHDKMKGQDRGGCFRMRRDLSTHERAPQWERELLHLSRSGGSGMLAMQGVRAGVDWYTPAHRESTVQGQNNKVRVSGNSGRWHMMACSEMPWVWGKIALSLLGGRHYTLKPELDNEGGGKLQIAAIKHIMRLLCCSLGMLC